jgi:hypothetical protein
MHRRLLDSVLTVIVAGQATITAAKTPDWAWLIIADGPTATAERAALVRALRLLPGLPARLAVLDADDAQTAVRPTLLRLDAFVTTGSPVVYVVRQSPLLRGAVAGSSLHIHALAAVVWHEMAHVAGADEREARKREQALWTRFIRDQRVDPVIALRYLSALDNRPDDQLLALR